MILNVECRIVGVVVVQLTVHDRNRVMMEVGQMNQSFSVEIELIGERTEMVPIVFDVSCLRRSAERESECNERK